MTSGSTGKTTRSAWTTSLAAQKRRSIGDWAWTGSNATGSRAPQPFEVGGLVRVRRGLDKLSRPVLRWVA